MTHQQRLCCLLHTHITLLHGPACFTCRCLKTELYFLNVADLSNIPQKQEFNHHF